MNASAVGEASSAPASHETAIAVVIATHNRAHLLPRTLAALSAQTLAHERFEVIVVDDASGDETSALLDAERARASVDLTVLRRERAGGPATAREEGWRASNAPLIAFTDDDCEPSADWLAQALAAALANPGAFIQGRTEPSPADRGNAGPFSRTITVTAPDAAYQTCNIVYPREVLERVGGFDTVAFGRAPGGEDSDLAWRAIATGTNAVFAPEMLVHHAIENVGPWGLLRAAARWTTPMAAYVRHPELRRSHFVKRFFWKGSHYLLVRAIVGLLLPRRWRWLTPWVSSPYLIEIFQRIRRDGGGPFLAPYVVLHDLVELIAVARAAIRYRSPML